MFVVGNTRTEYEESGGGLGGDLGRMMGKEKRKEEGEKRQYGEGQDNMLRKGIEEWEERTIEAGVFKG